MTALTIKTDATLLKRLSDSTKRKLTREELQKQRVSFIYAGMPKKSSITKPEIEKVLAESK